MQKKQEITFPSISYNKACVTSNM